MQDARSSRVRFKKMGRLGLTDHVYQQLEELILDQKLGPGEYLNIDKLCRELDVSSSPLREALARLSAQRLVRFEPFIGYTVAPIPDREYYNELMDVRRLLECRAARLGAPRRCRTSLEAMERATRAMDKLREGPYYKEYRAFNSWDAKFHRALVESSGNRVLAQAFADLHVLLHLSRLYLHFLSREFNPAPTVRAHDCILEAFKQGDADAAERAVASHLETIQILQIWDKIEASRTAPVEADA